MPENQDFLDKSWFYFNLLHHLYQRDEHTIHHLPFQSFPLLTELYDFLNTTRKEKAAVCWQRLFSLAGKPYQQFVYGVHGTVSFCLYLLISPLHKAMSNHSGYHRLKRDFLLSPRLHCFRNVTQAKGEWVNLTVGFCVIAPVLLHQAVYQHSHLIIVCTRTS